jgi:hypothetical protein
MTRSDARAMASRPEEQKRLTVAPETVMGKPGDLGGQPADVQPLFGFGKEQPIMTSSMALGSRLGFSPRPPSG